MSDPTQLPLNELTTLIPEGNASALLAIVDETAAPNKLPFPVVQVTGGNSAGAGTYGPLAGTPDEVALKLPAGRAAINGIFVGYRTEVIAWGTGYNNRDPESDGRPVWSGVLDPRNVEDAKLVAAACDAYQFTPGPKQGIASPQAGTKDAFDATGHPRPSVQLLIFTPALNDLLVLQAPAHQQTWALTTASLKRLVDAKTKQLGQFPCTIKPVVQDKSNPAFSWKVTHLEINQLVNDESAKWWAAFQDWRANAMLDPVKVALVREWINGTDRPISDDIRAKLQACAALAPARK